MKHLFIFITLVTSLFSYSQNVVEPDFIGEVLVLKPDNSTVKLDKSTTQIRSAGNAALIMTGIGSYVSKLQINGCCAKNRFKSSDKLQFIVKAVDNNTDPLAIVKIFRFQSYKRKRKAKISSTNIFGRTKDNELEYLPFSAKKYGENSYIITLNEQPVGEYGVTISNPNNVDEKSIIVSTFAFD